MQGNSLARRRDEQGHRDESSGASRGGETRQPPSGATPNRQALRPARPSLRVGGLSLRVTAGPEEWLPAPDGLARPGCTEPGLWAVSRYFYPCLHPALAE